MVWGEGGGGRDCGVEGLEILKSQIKPFLSSLSTFILRIYMFFVLVREMQQSFICNHAPTPGEGGG